MSRLGELLHAERLRRNMTLKQVAKLGGVSESYIKEVEDGKRIIADDQARRILKKMGLEEHTEQGFSLDDIANAVDLETVTPKRAAPHPEKKREPEAEPVYSDAPVEGSIWLDALSSMIKAVPVYNAVMKETDRRFLPVLGGKIEGANPDKVFYYLVPDDGMRGFRILKGDLCLVVPDSAPADNAVMLVQYNQHRFLRKIKVVDALTIMLQGYDKEYSAQTCSLAEVSFLGRVVRVEFSL